MKWSPLRYYDYDLWLTTLLGCEENSCRKEYWWIYDDIQETNWYEILTFADVLPNINVSAVEAVNGFNSLLLLLFFAHGRPRTVLRFRRRVYSNIRSRWATLMPFVHQPKESRLTPGRSIACIASLRSRHPNFYTHPGVRWKSIYLLSHPINIVEIGHDFQVWNCTFTYLELWQRKLALYFQNIVIIIKYNQTYAHNSVSWVTTA